MKKLVLAVIVSATLSGCNSTSKGQQEFDTANQLAAANQYQEAINYLTQAVNKNPKNAQYLQALNDLRSKFQSESVAKINLLLSGEYTNQGLNEALDLIQQLISNNAPADVTDGLTAQINEKQQALYAELEGLYKQAVSAYDSGDLVSSFQNLQAIENRFSNYEDVPVRLKTITKEINQKYIKEANLALKQDDFETATKLLNDVLAVNPSNGIAKALLAKVKKNNTPTYFIAKAKDAAGISNWEAALFNCEKALALDAGNSECLLLKDESKKELSKASQKGFIEAINESRMVVAKNLLRIIQDNGVTDITLIDEYKKTFAQKSDYLASQYIDKGQYAMAWNLLTSVQDVYSTYPDLFNKIRRVEDAISKRAKRSIAVFDFNSPADSDDAGVIVANNLISRLFNNASNDITILERENLKSILEEMKLGQIGVVSESTAKEMGRVYGIDYAIMGSVLLYKVDENNTESTKTIRYQTGEKISDNIDYLNWKAANPKPSKKDLQAAPQAKILVPEYGQTEYDVTQTKKVGFIELSFRIVDVLTGENTRVDTIERKLQVEDEANAGVAEAGVIFDPMEIPTDTEILQQLTEEVVESMASDVLRPLQQLETFYFNQGQDSEKRSEVESAIEYYTYAIFNERLKSVSSSPITNEARARISKLLNNHRFEE